MPDSATARETRSTCCYCGVGCGVVVRSEGGVIVDVRGDPDHPANFGRLCTKGSTLHLTAAPHLAAQTRLLRPMQRRARGEAPEPISWDSALDTLAARLADTHARHGADAIGLYVSGQLLTEDYYVFNKLAKGLLGTNNVDTNSRLCMSSAVSGYKATLGADAPPACYEDLALADLVFITGSNLAWAHPILCRRLEDAKAARPAQKWIVVDPRRTETAAMADLHLQIQPGSDVALAHGLLHLMLWEGFADHAFIAAHTTGFDALRDRVRECTPRETARATGLREEDIVTAARWWGEAAAVLSMYCQGLNQSAQGTANNAALINLHLATGQVGRAGAGPFSLTGQPNAMGGREVGGLANLLGGHREVGNPAHRAEIARLWGVDTLPERPGRTAVEMFEAAAEGEIKLLWIACTNPAQSMPDQAMVRRALERAEFVVVQEAYATTATAACADLLLPAASWGEKEGTVTNSERRISRVRAAIAPAGEARADWLIARDVARRVEARLRPGQASLFPYERPEDAWLEHRETPRGRDLDITGLSYALLESAGPQQWPLPEGAAAGRARLYEDGRSSRRPTDARASRMPRRRRSPKPRSARHPFALSTGRLRDQWHGMSRTGVLGRLNGHAPQPTIDLCAQDLGAPAHRRRPARARRVAPRRARAAGAARRCAGASAGLHRHALGCRGAARSRGFRRAARGRQRADLAGVLIRRPSSPSSSTARCASSPLPCRGACARWPGCRRARRSNGARRCVRCSKAWAMRAACLSAASPMRRVASASRSMPPRWRRRRPPCSTPCGACSRSMMRPCSTTVMGARSAGARCASRAMPRAASTCRPSGSAAWPRAMRRCSPRPGATRSSAMGRWGCPRADCSGPRRPMARPPRRAGRSSAPATTSASRPRRTRSMPRSATSRCASQGAGPKQLRCGTNCGSCLPHLRRLAQEQCNPVLEG